MAMYIYWFIGVIFEALVTIGYIRSGESYSRGERLLGGLIDILFWPVVILLGIIIGIIHYIRSR